MNKRDIAIGVVILFVLTGLIYYWRKPANEDLKVPQTLSVQDDIEDKFNISIPDEVDKAELIDVSGGNAYGIATREYINNKYVHTVLADLPELDSGNYEAELEKDGDTIKTGTLRLAKGGYLLEYESDLNLDDYKLVKVKSDDKIILQGSF